MWMTMLGVLNVNGGWADPEALVSGDAFALFLFIASTIFVEFAVVKRMLGRSNPATLGAVVIANLCSYVVGMISIAMLWGRDYPALAVLITVGLISGVMVAIFMSSLDLKGRCKNAEG